MKTLLILSYDIKRQNEPGESYSISSIKRFLKKEKGYLSSYRFDHISIDMNEIKDLKPENLGNSHYGNIRFPEYDFIALSVYAWSEPFINPVINYIKSTGFNGKLILGGNQISYSTDSELKRDYPLSDFFIRGYAEKSLYHIITKDEPGKVFYDDLMLKDDINPLYSTREIKVESEGLKVRFESKRGCPYSCSFCAHKQKNNRKIQVFDFRKTIQEFKYLNQGRVAKVNVIDPIFNCCNYLEVLTELVKMDFKPQLSLQTRFELISGERGRHFLDLCEQLNVTLEFGLQTIIEKEYKIIKRENDESKIKSVLKDLNARNIDYETSLIYGLPEQTVDSFKKSIGFLQTYGNKNIKAFPLMLLKGTELFYQRNTWDLKEEHIGDYGLPYVVSSSSFTKNGYKQMQTIANTL